MDIATTRDIVIIIYGGLGIILGIAGIALMIVLGVYGYRIYGKVLLILDDVKSLTEKIKIVSNYASREIIQPLIEISSSLQAAAEAIRQVLRIFKIKGGK